MSVNEKPVMLYLAAFACFLVIMVLLGGCATKKQYAKQQERIQTMAGAQLQLAGSQFKTNQMVSTKLKDLETRVEDLEIWRDFGTDTGDVVTGLEAEESDLNQSLMESLK